MVNFNCTAFVAMLSAFDGTSQSIEPWKVSTAMGTNYYGTATGHDLTEALAEGWYLTADQVAKEKIYGGSVYGERCDSGLALHQRDDELSRVTSNATANGLRSILYFINEGKGAGKISVKDGQLYYQGKSGDEVNLEPYLKKYKPDSDPSIIDVFFAATQLSPNTTGHFLDAESFGDVSLMVADKGKTGEVNTGGGCYLDLQSVKRWVPNLQSCGSRAIQNVLSKTGSACPLMSCLYLRQGSKKQQSASFSFGFNFDAVEGPSCKTFTLEAAALA